MSKRPNDFSMRFTKSDYRYGRFKSSLIFGPFGLFQGNMDPRDCVHLFHHILLFRLEPIFAAWPGYQIPGAMPEMELGNPIVT
jgi:hypothetical protein